jgi:mRNA-degrading endonuclease HigB of HigAB toxin-antitoxin module
MTLAPTNEAIRHYNHAEKNLCLGKKINRHDWEVMEDVKSVLPSNTRKVFLRVGDLIFIISDYFAYL